MLLSGYARKFLVVLLRGGSVVRFRKTSFALLLLVLAVSSVPAQDKTVGGIKGRVRVEVGSPNGVTVVLRRGEKQLSQATTDKNGEFQISRLPPGIYGLTFRKPGLSVGTIEDVEVKAGKIRTLGDRLVLTIDDGSIAFIKGSVFTAAGRSVANAKVELSRILENGTTKKIDGRLTNETGSFVFRLSPEVAKYRVSLKADGGDPITRDVDIDGPAVYRVALSLAPPTKP
jgi:hypothetical protein